MPRKLLTTTLFFTLGLFSSFAYSFDLKGAVLVEAQLRAVSRVCASSEFSKKFTAQSKEQVAFSLIGEDKYDPNKVELLIQEIDREISSVKPQAMDCDKVYLDLENLYDTRKKSLLQSKEITKELQQIQN